MTGGSSGQASGGASGAPNAGAGGASGGMAGSAGAAGGTGGAPASACGVNPALGTGKIQMESHRAARFAAYELDGPFLWRVDLGINVRESDHITNFVVYDLDGDGSAELTVKTATGTRDGTGAFLSKGPAANDDDDDADYRNSARKIIGDNPEYLTVFSGRTGAELATIAYHAPYTSGSFGDSNGNRSDRYNATGAFLATDGRPSAVMQRGYYERTTFGAYDFRDGQLSLLWSFDSEASGNED